MGDFEVRLRSTAALCALLAACAAPPPGAPDAGARAAAVALRDEVPGYQQLGTELFTVPRLSEAYAQHWYLTESGGRGQRRAFVDALTDATARYDAVDVFLLAHGNRYFEWVEDVPAAQRRRIRLVYNTGGGGSAQAAAWLSLGVEAYVAHPGGNIAPVFYVDFLERWTRGEPLEDAVDAANRRTHDALFSPASTVGSALVEQLGGRPVSLGELWAGTEAQVFRRGGAGQHGW